MSEYKADRYVFRVHLTKVYLCVLQFCTLGPQDDIFWMPDYIICAQHRSTDLKVLFK